VPDSCSGRDERLIAQLRRRNDARRRQRRIGRQRDNERIAMHGARLDAFRVRHRRPHVGDIDAPFHQQRAGLAHYDFLDADLDERIARPKAAHGRLQHAGVDR